MNRKFFITVVLLLFVLAASACYPFTSGGIPVAGQGGQPANSETQNAQIWQAVQGTATTIAMQQQISQLQTQVAAAQGGQGNPTEVAAEAITLTATPTATPTVTITVTATPTVTVTNTPVPTNTLVPTATATAIPCNLASFVGDVSVPDGTTFSPNTDFTKTWRIRNTGACTWTTAYDIVYEGGTRMGSPSSFEMPGRVLPGQVIDISVDLTAPSDEGRYRANFKLRDASGIIFGMGRSNTTFFADIRVSEPSSDEPLDFIDRMCDASWTSGAGSLPCPGSSSDTRGYVQRIDDPTLESGYVDDEPALRMVPEQIDDGYIRGKFPAIAVKSGYHFVSIVGCAYNDSGCDVIFELNYQEGSGAIKTLKTWHEKYDKKFTTVDVDLSSLAGKNIKFFLTVKANGSSSKDKGQWLLPRVTKP